MSDTAIAASLLSIYTPINPALAKERYEKHVRIEIDAAIERLSKGRPSDAHSFDYYEEPPAAQRLVQRATVLPDGNKAYSWYVLTGSGGIVLESDSGSREPVNLSDIDVQALKLILVVLVGLG